jgi:hypothetical protein
MMEEFSQKRSDDDEEVAQKGSVSRRRLRRLRRQSCLRRGRLELMRIELL